MRHTRPARQRGVAAVEFAILLLPILLIAFGIVEFGREIGRASGRVSVDVLA